MENAGGSKMVEQAFDRDVSYLKEAVEKLQQVAVLEGSVGTADAEMKKLTKQIVQAQKQKEDALAAALKKRRSEVEAAYDKEIEAVRTKIKKVNHKRENQKNKQQNQHYREQTEEFRQEVEDCVIEIGNIIKQNHIMRFCRSDLYYSLFLPRGIKDGLVFLLWFLITVIVVPAAICGIGRYTFLAQVQSQTVYYILIFVCCISVVFITYLLIASRTRLRYRDELLRCRNEKVKIKAIKKQMRAVRNKINKDKDESKYNLDDFDEQLEKYKTQMETIGENKKSAVETFMAQTWPQVESELESRHDAHILELQQQRDERETQQAQEEQQLQALRLELANNYEAYLGKEYMTEERLNRLIDIMEEERAATVGDAIAVLQGELQR
jgi:hypothetical protein